MYSHTDQGAEGERLCFMVYLIGRLKHDLGFDGSFCELLTLALGWPVLFIGQFVETRSFVIVIISYQKSVFVPCVDGGVVHIEFLGHFALGE